MLSACNQSATPTPFIAPHSEKITPIEGTDIAETVVPNVTPSLPNNASTQQPVELTPTFAESETSLTPVPTFTLIPTQEPTLDVPGQETQSPTVEACLDSLKFLQDINFPDGSNVSPGAMIEKQWSVENNGTCDWNEQYRLKLVTGFPSLGAPGELALSPTRAGEQATITINFTAPLETGTFRTTWQAYNPEGVAFGEPIYMEIIVIQ